MLLHELCAGVRDGGGPRFGVGAGVGGRGVEEEAGGVDVGQGEGFGHAVELLGQEGVFLWEGGVKRKCEIGVIWL